VVDTVGSSASSAARTEHGIYDMGLEDLVLVVVAWPTDDMSR